MNLSSLLTEERVLMNLEASEADDAMVEMVEQFAKMGILVNGMKDRALVALQNRESQISTGIGCGVGVPHAYLEDLAEPVALFGRSEEGIEFCSCDHAPVHFVVMMLIPESKRAQHLVTLADIGKRFLSCETRKDLASAQSESEVLAVLSR